MLAASLSCDAPVSHRSAAWLWNLLDPTDVVDVSVRYPRRAALWAPATAHRIRDLTERHVVERDGLRITTPIRTIVDLGLVVPWWVVDRALGRGIARRLFPVGAVRALREDLARRGRNGTGVTQRVLDERLLRGADEDSALEARFLRVLRRFGLPAPEFQYEVWDGGRFVARVDAAYPDRKVAIEVDGFEFHSSPDAFQADRTRQNDLVRLGWRVLRFTASDVIRAPRVIADTLHPVL
jgi:very-short-patch-repair endonuclease